MIIYQYDGTIDGLLTCIYNARKLKHKNALFTFETSAFQLSFDTQFIQINTDLDKADSLLSSLKPILKNKGISDIYHVFESCDSQKDSIIFNYINTAFEHGSSVTHMLAHPHVILFNELNKKVRNEIHRMSGFIRFVKTKNDIYYAAYSPENNITAFLMPEFVSRYPIMCFALHDVMRGIIGIYNGDEYIIVKDQKRASIEYADNEEYIQKLWQTYYKHVNIKERYNRRQMLSYMPKKYTDNIFTFHDFEK